MRGASDSGRTMVRLLPVVAAAVAALHALWLLSTNDWLACDDAYISFRYADNLASGHGLVFNEGEPIEGYSNFLWVLLLTPFCWLTEDLTAVSVVLGLVCLVGIVLLADRMLLHVYEVRSALARCTCAAVIAGSGYVCAWAVSGLASALHGLLLLGIWYRFAVESRPGHRGRQWTGWLLLALALLRPEGLLVAAAGLALQLVLVRARRRAGDAPRLGGFLVVLVGGLLLYHALRFAWFGPHLFPNTVRAKVGDSAQQLWRGMLYVEERFFVPYLPLLVCLVLPAWPRQRLASAIGACLFAGHLLFVAAVGGDWSMGRLFAPFLPIAAVLAGACVDYTWRARRAAALPIALVLAGLSFYAFWVTTISRERLLRTVFAAIDRSRVEIGQWLREASPPDTVVAVYAAGQIPYFSRRRAHDMLGLNDAHIANLPVELGHGAPGHEKFDVEYTLAIVRPDVIVDGNRVPGLVEHPLVTSDYEVYGGFRFNHVLVRKDAAWAKGD